MFVCSDHTCQQVFVEPRCDCSRCGSKVVLNYCLSNQTTQRADSYVNRYCDTYRPATVTLSTTAQYNAIRLTWHGTHGREAHLEFHDGGGVYLMLLSKMSSQVLPHITEHDNGALQIIQSFLHGE